MNSEGGLGSKKIFKKKSEIVKGVNKEFNCSVI